MDKINREELNRRFNEVYQKLVDKKEIVKSDRSRSKTAFAKKLGTKGHIIDLYLKGERQITYEQAKLYQSIYCGYFTVFYVGINYRFGGFAYSKA